MRVKVIIALAVMLLSAGSAFAEVRLKAEVDKIKITTDEAVIYKLTIASSEKNLPAPQIPKFDGFNVVSQSSSSSASFAESKVKVTVIYTFILAPADTGRFKIEPATIKIKDKIYATDSFEIEVTAGKAKPRPRPQEKPPLPQELLPETDSSQITL